MPKFEGLHASEILQSAPQGAGYNEAHLKCFNTHARSMQNKQELEALSQSRIYNVTEVYEIWWEESGDWLQAFQKRQAEKASGTVSFPGAGLYGADTCQQLG